MDPLRKLREFIGISQASVANPYLMAKRDSGKITDDQYNQIVKNGYVDEWKQDAINKKKLAQQQEYDNLYGKYEKQVSNNTATQIPFLIAEEMMNKGKLPQSGYEAPSVKGTSSNYEGIGDLAAQWYTTVGHPESAERARTLANKAVQYGLDPYIALALGAQEGGWLNIASPEAPNNYMGFGETDSGSLGMGEASFEDWLDKYIPSNYMQPIYGETPYGKRTSVKEWGGTESPYKYNYNYNDTWVNAIASLMTDAEAIRKQNYPHLSPSSIRY